MRGEAGFLGLVGLGDAGAPCSVSIKERSNTASAGSTHSVTLAAFWPPARRDGGCFFSGASPPYAAPWEELFRMGVAPAWVFSPLELPALPFPLLPGISRWHLWPHNSNAHALCSPVHHLPRDREGKCSDGHPEGHPRGVRISPAFWGVLCLVGASLPLPSVHGGSEATHPMAPVFHGNVSRAVRKLVSSVSVPHHPTSSHRRDHCAPDAALAPSHQPGLCIPHAN